MGTIVVGVDGSEGSRRAIRWAVREAGLRGADVHLVHALAPLPAGSIYAEPMAAIEQAAHEVVDEARDLAVRVASDGPSVEVQAAVEFGQPAPVLLDASKGADLLVVGSRGRGAFAGLLLGSVSFHCASHARCPVVVVRSADE
jgi:nucleotide-binding universal stress UspA family protein